jgi:hypothetical protein
LNTYWLQVAETASSLNSDDCFVLVTPTMVFSWSGNGATVEETTVAFNISSVLAGDYLGRGGRELAVVKEGEEPEAFWAALGGKAEYASHAPGELPPQPPRLFWCSTSTGAFRVEEV